MGVSGGEGREGRNSQVKKQKRHPASTFRALLADCMASQGLGRSRKTAGEESNSRSADGSLQPIQTTMAAFHTSMGHTFQSEPILADITTSEGYDG